MVDIYTDGASKGNPGPGGWGAIVAHDDNVAELGGREEHTTNNRMELTAVIRAVGSLAEDSATVHTDSEYVMKGMTEWVEGWQRRGWKTSAKKPVLNQDLWQELLDVSADKNLEWEYVRGHTGHDANERCDEIATGFAGGEDIELYHGPRDRYFIKLQ